VREAVAIWSDYEGSPIKVQYVDKLSQADVFIERVTVYDDIPYGSAGRTSATYERKGEAETKILTRAHVRIYCPTFDGSDWENQDVKMSSFAKIQFKCLLVHELGHVFGLGHSPAGPDIMFWKSCAQRLSNRDMNTVKIIYKHVGKSARGPNGRAG
jgi:predicted Zn-dependent protease